MGDTDNYYPTDNQHELQEGPSLVPPQPQDNTPPFSQPDDPVDDPAAEIDERDRTNHLSTTHPATDSATDIDTQDQYDASLASAADAYEPNRGDNVVGYNPDKDKPDKDQHRNQAA